VKRVLVVDDKAEAAYFLRALLEGHGYRVETSADGQDALDKARQEPPDLIVSDLLMPVLDGYALLREWKADPRLCHAPFIVYTATYTEPADEQLARDLGADAFLHKPADPDELLEHIRSVLDHAKASGAAASARATDDEPLLRRYNATLIRKLEDRTAQLEKANRRLHEEHAQLVLQDRVLQAVSQGILICDACAPDLPIIYASPGFERLTGYRAAEIAGRNCRFLQGPDTDRNTVAKIREALAREHPCSVEILNYRQDGTPFYNELTISPVRDEQGRTTHFVGVQTDVTERRELEMQLRQAQKLEAVGQLAAGVAHDFNNLLSVIMSYATFAVESVGPGQLRDDLEEIRMAGERAATLTRQLLAFSRQQVLQPRVLAVPEVVAGMDKLLRRLIGEQVSLTIEARGTFLVFVDPGEIEQILVNLAVNARDAMPDGGALTIEIDDVSLDEAYADDHVDLTPGDYVMLAVTDSGVGMDATVRERIFEPFFTTKTEGRGTGLGLATVYGIVKQSEGHILVYSEPGQGTTFKIFLPRHEGAHGSDRGTAGPPARLDGDETVLVVEDEDKVRAIACAILERKGYTVLHAANGPDALALAAAHPGPIHLLLTDVVMPKMSGGQLARELKAERPDAIVMYMSGYTENTALRRNVIDGTARFVPKPLTPARLLRAVRAALDGD